MSSNVGDRSRLAEHAATLRELHVPGRPLLLPNAWDSASARSVAAVGFPAVATASAAISASLGFPDHQKIPPDEMFAAIRRIVTAVAVPVTADVEAGYGLAAGELVNRLLQAGAVGCNLEDTNHRDGGLVDAAVQAVRIASIREAAERSGIPIVINARVDTYLHDDLDPNPRATDALERCRVYLEAGADCVYPIGLEDEDAIAWLAGELGGRINVLASPSAPPLPRLIALDVARVSFGPWVQRLGMREVDAVLGDIFARRDPYATRVSSRPPTNRDSSR